MAEDKHSKTEQPTAKRRREAEKKSGLPQSRDLSSTLTLLAALLFLNAGGGFIVSRLQMQTKEVLNSIPTLRLTEAEVYNLLLRTVGLVSEVILPFMITVTLAGAAVAVVQQGQFSISMERLSADFGKLNPINGFSKLFSKNSLIETVKSLLKVLIVGYIVYLILRDELDAILYLTENDAAGVFAFVSRISYKMLLHACGVLLVVGLLDLAYVKWKFTDDLKMTKEEVKQENKDMEGSPELKAKFRQVRVERARKWLRKTIPTADVVITNPTHFAVALKYDRDMMAAPRVVAKGADYMALAIKELAREYGVTMVENRFLARQLYKMVKEDEEIPETLYAAVAEILAYVYSLKGKV